jgi:hypothetical protein
MCILSGAACKLEDFVQGRKIALEPSAVIGNDFFNVHVPAKVIFALPPTTLDTNAYY